MDTAQRGVGTIEFEAYAHGSRGPACGPARSLDQVGVGERVNHECDRRKSALARNETLERLAIRGGIGDKNVIESLVDEIEGLGKAKGEEPASERALGPLNQERHTQRLGCDANGGGSCALCKRPGIGVETLEVQDNHWASSYAGFCQGTLITGDVAHARSRRIPSHDPRARKP